MVPGYTASTLWPAEYSGAFPLPGDPSGRGSGTSAEPSAVYVLDIYKTVGENELGDDLPIGERIDVRIGFLICIFDLVSVPSGTKTVGN